MSQHVLQIGLVQGGMAGRTGLGCVRFEPHAEAVGAGGHGGRGPVMFAYGENMQCNNPRRPW